METYYVLIVGFLFLLAVSLLIIGVSNDAVNFLNSAIGSNAASFQVILAIATAGVLIGAIFSNGMMEVARKGIFNPEHFAFSEIMIIFLAVMLTNILLLDFFNTVGLPTSTTVSIVFGLFGASVAVSVYKITGSDAATEVGTYINIENSMLIIAGIFLSVVIAFTAGMIIQWIVRFAFSFNIRKSYKYCSGIWGGVAITTILYFLLIKGAEGSTLVTPQMLAFMNTYTAQILLVSLLGWTLLFQLLVFFTRINILKIIVLAGTFALAMAFAGNDLVNFIGVPLAGFESFRAFSAAGGADAGGFMMEALREPVNTPVYFLLASGLIMILTLRFSKKARTVTATTIDLSRQDAGYERFASSSLARFIVRRTVEFSNGVGKITPRLVNRFIRKRFDAEQARDDKQEKIAFDLVRASVNLVVASILIAFGTSHRLPLSTTYVTFMVAMGTSLADGAWGRDSAVFRITGVLTVVGGWFFTAFSAFLVSFIIATLIYFGKLPVIVILIGLSSYILLRTHTFHRKRIEKETRLNGIVRTSSREILKSCDDEVKTAIIKASKIFSLTYTSFLKEKRGELKSARKEAKHLSREIKHIQEEIPETLRKFDVTDLEIGRHYVQVVAYMKEMSNSLLHIVLPAYNHLDNNYAFDREQTNQLKELNDRMGEFFKFITNLLKIKNNGQMEELVHRRDEMMDLVNEILLSRIKILKKNKKGVKISVTYIEMLTETKNLLLDLVQLVKSEVNLVQSPVTEKTLLAEVLD